MEMSPFGMDLTYDFSSKKCNMLKHRCGGSTYFGWHAWRGSIGSYNTTTCHISKCQIQGNNIYGPSGLFESQGYLSIRLRHHAWWHSYDTCNHGDSLLGSKGTYTLHKVMLQNCCFSINSHPSHGREAIVKQSLAGHLPDFLGDNTHMEV